MSTKIICAAVAAMAVLSNAAEATTFHVPTIAVPRPVMAAPRPVMATSPISKTPASAPAGTLAPTGVILNYDSAGRATSATLVGGHAPGLSTPISGRLTIPGGGKTAPSASSGSTGGAGLAHNAQNSKDGTNSSDALQARQATSGVNCNRTLHNLHFC